MPAHLSKIVIRGGDRGVTSLGDGSRVDKDAPRIEAIGTVDELNSWIGLLCGYLSQIGGTAPIADQLSLVQHDLFDLGGGLSKPGQTLLSAEHVARLDALTEEINTDLPPLEEFILPGGPPATGAAHIARTVCRRAERRLITLQTIDPQPSEHGLAYLNHLSDVLFSVARCMNSALGVPDLLWEAQKVPKPKRDA
ncbi:MAG: cob(I)yrinic acid a,c-diamide adenosyltransferase [Pseudomonadota bacterium]